MPIARETLNRTEALLLVAAVTSVCTISMNGRQPQDEVRVSAQPVVREALGLSLVPQRGEQKEAEVNDGDEGRDRAKRAAEAYRNKRFLEAFQEQRRQPPDLLLRLDRLVRLSPHEVGKRPVELAARLAQQGADLAGQITRGGELGGVLPITRRGRVVDEEHDSAVGRLLQHGGEERLAYDARFLLVGRDQDRQCRRVAAMDAGSRPTRMGYDAWRSAQPRELVDEAGEQEEADQALADEQFG